MIDIFTSVFSRSLVNISSNLFISNKYQHVLFVLILLYTTSVSCQLPCLSNRLTSDGGNYKYQNILDYTSDMCSQCYSFILSPGLNLIPKPGTNGTKLQRPLYYYVMPNTGLLCMTNKPQKAYCNFALPEKFNRTHPHKDWFLSTFKTNFHLVSDILNALSNWLECVTLKRRHRKFFVLSLLSHTQSRCLTLYILLISFSLAFVLSFFVSLAITWFIGNLHLLSTNRVYIFLHLLCGQECFSQMLWWCSQLLHQSIK